MVVRTRSSYNTTESVAVDSISQPSAVVTAPVCAPRRSVRLSTPSYTHASIRSYKIYTPKTRGKKCHSQDSEPKPKPEPEQDFGSENEEDNAIAASEILVSLSRGDAVEDDPIPNTSFTSRCCLNPMHAVTRYIYKLTVCDMSQTTHYNTSYVMYNRETRLYYVYSVISTMLVGGCQNGRGDMASSSPEPTNAIQTKYITYVNVDKYIMNVVIPSPQREYCVMSDFIGVISTGDEFKHRAFSENSDYYDLDEIWNTTDSSDTLTGHQMFILTPTRVYYWDAGAGVLPTNSMYKVQDINDAVDIIASVQ